MSGAHPLRRTLARLRGPLDAALAGRFGLRTARATRWLLSLHPEYRAATLCRDGRLSEALAILRPRRRLGVLGRSIRARCEDALAVLRLPPDVPAAPRRAPPGATRALYAMHSCSAFDPSGYTARTDALLSALHRRGIAMHATTRLGYPWDLPSHAARSVLAQVEVDGRPVQLLHDPAGLLGGAERRYVDAYADRLVQQARAAQVGVLHAASNYLNGLAAAAAARRLDLPCIYEVRGLWHLTRAFREPAYAATEHFRYAERQELAACLQADRVVAISAPLHDWLVARGVAAERIRIVGNAAPATPPASGDDARVELGLAAGQPVFGYFGALAPYEGLDDLLRAFATIDPARDARLLILGDGSERMSLQHLARALGIAPRVRFVGRVPQHEVPRYLRCMDLVVLPRKDHALTRMVPAIKPFEALAAGRPVAVSASLAAALRDSLEGFVVLPDGDAHAVGRALEATIAAPPRVDSATVPTWTHRADALATLYAELGLAA